jgi:two-component system, chemotaxis family, chemotaxis protein CheY
VRALVIDDSRAVRTILSRRMTGAGFVVVEASNGQEAIRLLESGPLPDLALVDWNMPVMNGLEFLTEVRKRPEWRTMTMIMVATESEYHNVVRALTAGAHGYVTKPFTPDAIEDELELHGLGSEVTT